MTDVKAAYSPFSPLLLWRPLPWGWCWKCQLLDLLQWPNHLIESLYILNFIHYSITTNAAPHYIRNYQYLLVFLCIFELVGFCSCCDGNLSYFSVAEFVCHFSSDLMLMFWAFLSVHARILIWGWERHWQLILFFLWLINTAIKLAKWVPGI